MIEILDTIKTQSLALGLTINYVALSTKLMTQLVSEVASNIMDQRFTVDTITSFSDIPLKVKDIEGFQVAYKI